MSRILLVERDGTQLREHARLLESRAHEVTAAETTMEALQLLGGVIPSFDVIILEISSPGLDGAFLASIQTQNPGAQVAIVTNANHHDPTQQKLERSAFARFSSPLKAAQLLEAVRLGSGDSTTGRERKATASVAPDKAVLEPGPDVEAAFDRAMASLWMAYQPIVDWPARRVLGYEALLRCNEPEYVRPDVFLPAAAALGRSRELARRARAAVARDIAKAPTDALIFVNIHASDLEDDDLYDDDSALSPFGSRVVLEVTERASVVTMSDLKQRTIRLREMGYRIAIDDMGAGYAGLTTLALLEPEVVKIDMSLIRNVEKSATKQRVIGALLTMCRDGNLLAVAEGIETQTERDAMVTLGCNYLQGHLFARPQSGFVRPLGLEPGSDAA